MLEDKQLVFGAELDFESFQGDDPLFKRDLAVQVPIEEAEGRTERIEPFLHPYPDELHRASQMHILWRFI